VLTGLDSATVGAAERVACCPTAERKLVVLHDDLLDVAPNLSGWAQQPSMRDIADARLPSANRDLSSDQEPDEMFALTSANCCRVQMVKRRSTRRLRAQTISSPQPRRPSWWLGPRRPLPSQTRSTKGREPVGDSMSLGDSHGPRLSVAKRRERRPQRP
jgi:hypothetical protein